MNLATRRLRVTRTGSGKHERCFPRWVWWGVFFFGMYAVDLLQGIQSECGVGGLSRFTYDERTMTA
jgi:hypothetical protein